MRFSVALCTYNGAAYIREQINSILCQTYPVDEVIICDDGSKDETVCIADTLLKQSGIKYKIMVNDHSLGVANNFLKALKNTTADYVFTCDQDDIWTEDKVEAFLNKIRVSGKLLYFSNGVLADKMGESMGIFLWDIVGFTYDASQNSYFNIILRHPIVTGAAMCVSRELINRIETIPEAFLHDEWFSVVAAANNSIEAINEITFFYRQHGNNVLGASKRNFAQKFSLWCQNINRLDQLRAAKLTRVQSISSIVVSEDYRATVDRAESFWNDMCLLNSKGFFKRIKTIFGHLFKGNYTLFYTGPRGFLRDLIKLFVPNKNLSKGV